MAAQTEVETKAEAEVEVEAALAARDQVPAEVEFNLRAARPGQRQRALGVPGTPISGGTSARSGGRGTTIARNADGAADCGLLETRNRKLMGGKSCRQIERISDLIFLFFYSAHHCYLFFISFVKTSSHRERA